jgi:hypothetical protein
VQYTGNSEKLQGKLGGINDGVIETISQDGTLHYLNPNNYSGKTGSWKIDQVRRLMQP